jgi:hypothetical protein
MPTLRKWLDEKDFDWDNGYIIYQEVGEDERPGWGEPISGQYITSDDPILDFEFHNGYGGPECPRIIARDDGAVYFPGQYDGATWLNKIIYDLDVYLDYKNNPTPYPGG